MERFQNSENRLWLVGKGWVFRERQSEDAGEVLRVGTGVAARWHWGDTVAPATCRGSQCRRRNPTLPNGHNRLTCFYTARMASQPVMTFSTVLPKWNKVCAHTFICIYRYRYIIFLHYLVIHCMFSYYFKSFKNIHRIEWVTPNCVPNSSFWLTYQMTNNSFPLGWLGLRHDRTCSH